MSNTKTIIIEKGRYATYYEEELKEIINQELEDNEYVIVTITTPNKIIRGEH